MIVKKTTAPPGAAETGVTYRIRLERKELRKAVRTVFDEIAKSAGLSVDSILSQAGAAVYGEDDDDGFVFAGGGWDADPGKEPDDGDACGMDFGGWEESWARGEEEFLKAVVRRGAGEIAKRKIADDRLALSDFEGETALLTELFDRIRAQREAESEEEEVLTAGNFLDPDTEGSAGDRVRKMTAVITEYVSPAGDGRGGEEHRGEIYERLMEIMELQHLEYRAWRLVRSERRRAMETLSPFVPPFDPKIVVLDADGRTFRVREDARG